MPGSHQDTYLTVRTLWLTPGPSWRPKKELQVARDTWYQGTVPVSRGMIWKWFCTGSAMQNTCWCFPVDWFLFFSHQKGRKHWLWKMSKADSACLLWIAYRLEVVITVQGEWLDAILYYGKYILPENHSKIRYIFVLLEKWDLQIIQKAIPSPLVIGNSNNALSSLGTEPLLAFWLNCLQELEGSSNPCRQRNGPR